MEKCRVDGSVSEVDLAVALPAKRIQWYGDDANRGTGDWGQQRSGINYHL